MKEIFTDMVNLIKRLANAIMAFMKKVLSMDMVFIKIRKRITCLLEYGKIINDKE